MSYQMDYLRMHKLKTGYLDVMKKTNLNGDMTCDGTVSAKCFVTTDGCNDADAIANARYNEKRGYFTDLEAEYIANGTVDWDTFYADPTTHQRKKVTLSQSDFANGTLRIHHPCLLSLSEHIAFNPNRPETWLDGSDSVTSAFSEANKIDPNRVLDWMPDQTNGTNNAQYFQNDVAFAYGLGFFSAIAVETAGVIFCGNGYTIQQHQEHALQQRFFAVIELADQPFIPFQGPSNFGAILKSASSCLIKNVKIGLSSHHGIHGNDCDNIMMENVTFENFEVASLSLNGCNSGFFKNVTVNTNRRDIPVLGTYSAARFSKSFVRHVQNMAISTTGLDNASAALALEMDNVFNKVIFNSGTAIPDYILNDSQLIDGTAYGIVFNAKGVAVNGFLEDRTTSKAGESSDIVMINCNISNIKGKINEIVALKNPDGGMQVDTAGAVLQFFNGVSNLVGDKYFYTGTGLSNVKIELAKIKQARVEAMESVSFFGTLNIHKGISLWKDTPTNYFKFVNGQLQLFNNSNDPILISGQPVVYDIACNGDTMFHVNKGIMGLRCDGVTTMYSSNCSINNIESVGELGSLLCGNYISSHPSQGTLLGYNGGKCYGAVFSAVSDINALNLSMNNIHSENSTSSGLTVQNYSVNSNFENLIMNGVTSNDDFDPSRPLLPNEQGRASAIKIWKHCTNIKIKNPTITSVSDNCFIQRDVNVQSISF